MKPKKAISIKEMTHLKTYRPISKEEMVLSENL
jgi:hypothetical protein